MRSPSRADLGDRLVGLLPPGAVAVAEGAWIAVVHAAVTVGLLHGAAGPGVVAFAAAAGLGIVAARRAAPATPAGAAWRGAAIAAAGLAGWAADPAVQGSLAAGALPASTAAGATGLLLALAAWRGTRHREATADDLAVGTLLARGVPGLAVPWIIGSASPATRGAFGAEALPATLLFVAGGLAAIGLTRLDAVSRAAGVDWRGRRAWPALIGGVVVVVLALGVPAALLLDVPLATLVRFVTDPLAHAGTAVSDALRGVIGSGGSAAPPAPAPGVPGPPAAGGGAAVTGILVLLLAAVGGVAAAAVALLVRDRESRGPRVPPPAPEPAESRRLVLPALRFRAPRPRLPRFARLAAERPRTAADAYALLVEDRATDPATARRAGESPSAHARRLRAAGRGALGLDLLAADYALERYADVRLTARETRRAAARWRALRRRWPVGRSAGRRVAP